MALTTTPSRTPTQTASGTPTALATNTHTPTHTPPAATHTATQTPSASPTPSSTPGQGPCGKRGVDGQFYSASQSPGSFVSGTEVTTELDGITPWFDRLLIYGPYNVGSSGSGQGLTNVACVASRTPYNKEVWLLVPTGESYTSSAIADATWLSQNGCVARLVAGRYNPAVTWNQVLALKNTLESIGPTVAIRLPSDVFHAQKASLLGTASMYMAESIPDTGLLAADALPEFRGSYDELIGDGYPANQLVMLTAYDSPTPALQTQAGLYFQGIQDWSREAERPFWILKARSEPLGPLPEMSIRNTDGSWKTDAIKQAVTCQ